MIKAAPLTFSLTLLVATALASQALARQSDQQMAIDTAVRQEANRITLRQKLTDARSAEERRELATAAKLYDEAWDLVQQIGPANVEAETARTRAGLAVVRLELARAAQHSSNFREANVQVTDVLRVDKTNAEALTFKRENDKLLAAQRGRIPSDEAQREIPGIITNKVNASTLVRDGMLFYQMGKYDEAKTKLHQALKLDPQNQAAYYYLNLVSEADFKNALNKRDVASRKALTDVEKEWALPTQGELLPKPNPYAQSTLVHTSKGRQAILSKLDRIQLDEVKYENLPLSEVVISLSDQAKKRDPERRGINFIINPNVEAVAIPAPLQGATDPTTGLPMPAPGPTEPVDISTASIKINPPLANVRLADALEAIVRVANIPIKYSIEDYAVVFSHKGLETPPLYSRTFKVDPNTFMQGLQGVGNFVFGETMAGQGGMGGGMGGRSGGSMGGGQTGNSVVGAIIPRVTVAPGGVSGGRSGGGSGGGGGNVTGAGVNFITTTNRTADMSLLARDYFSVLGVNLDPPKSVFFNDRQGTLLVRATMQDLDTIEAAIQALNIAPPQINIKAKFVEVSQDDNKALGFDWYLGNVLMAGGKIGGQGGTAPSFTGSPSRANPIGTFPGNPAAGTAIAPSTSDQLITKGLRNSPDALFSLTGILTDPQFRMVLHAIDQRQGADILSSPEVTTLSGRQAQMKATEIKTVVTAFDFSQQVGGYNTGTGF